jgi:pyridoxine kinase
MAEILSIQSTVVYGRVGHGAASFALERLGHDVWPLPTVLLSNHTGYPVVTGRRLPAADLAELARGLRANGTLDRIAAVQSGYLGTEEVAGFVAGLVRDLRAARPGALYLCDPVLGDHGPGRYLPEAVGVALREKLLPLADIATPNEWELGWLTGRVLPDLGAVVAAARALAAAGPGRVVVTSVRAGLPADEIGILAVADGQATLVRTPFVPIHCYGTGDLAAALVLEGFLAGRTPAAIAARTASVMHAVIAHTAATGRTELDVIGAQASVVAPPRLFVAEPVIA